jgi:hypothetical protein
MWRDQLAADKYGVRSDASGRRRGMCDDQATP